MKNCIECQDAHHRMRKAVWFHKDKYAGAYCDACYQANLEYLKQYKKRQSK